MMSKQNTSDNETDTRTDTDIEYVILSISY